MNFNKFTQKSMEAVQNCEKLAYEYGNQEIEQEHLLYSLLTLEDSLILKLIEKQKMIAEGAGAVSVAAAMFNKFPIQGKKVVCVISGGNIDVTSLSRVINRGLMKSGRTATLRIELMDKPGMLKDVTNIIADHGGNVTGVHHDRGRSENINECILRIDLETRNYEHIEEILAAMRQQGIKVTLG